MPNTNFVTDSTVRINGQKVPNAEWSVDINAYSIASTLQATIPKKKVRGYYYPPNGDWGLVAQNTQPLPFEIDLGIATDGKSAPQNLALETGYVDETLVQGKDESIEFTGRGAASLFQDVQITAPQLRNARGSDIISSIFAKRGVPLVIVAPSPAYAGKTNDDSLFDQGMRGRSEWDIMQAISVADGYRLTMHLGVGYYGPFGLNTDPVLNILWGQPQLSDVPVIDWNVKHSPRKSHNIAVRIFSYQPRSGRSISVSYGHSNATEGEQFDIPVKAGQTRLQLQQMVQTVFNDIAKREHLLEIDLVPNAKLIQTVNSVGSNFSMNFGGTGVWPSFSQIYEVRSIHFERSKGRGGIPVRAHVIAGNINPVQAGGFLS